MAARQEHLLARHVQRKGWKAADLVTWRDHGSGMLGGSRRDQNKGW